MYDRAVVLDLVERAKLDDKKASQRLFSLLALERWMLMFVDGKVSATAPTPPAARRLAKMPNPRILILVQNEPLPQDRHVWNQCRALTGAGYDVTVVCPQGATRHQEPYERLQGVDIHRYRPRTADGGIVAYGLEYASALWSMGRLARRLAKQRPFDLVHACSPPDFLLLAVLPLRRAGHAVHLRPPRPHARAVRLALRPPGRARSTARRCSPSRWPSGSPTSCCRSTTPTARSRSTRGRRRPEDVFVVRTGPDLTPLRAGRARARRSSAASRYLLSYVGVMGPQDGVDHAIRALAALKQPPRATGTRCSWATARCSPRCSELADELGLDDDVEFSGWVEHDTVAACSRPPTSASRRTRRTRSTTSRR